MLLSKKTSIKVSREYANLIGHMCYAASKLWNVCNYERQHYKETGMEQYPDWYYQKKAHKEDLWYKQLPSQSAQEVCRLLDKAWIRSNSCGSIRRRREAVKLLLFMRSLTRKNFHRTDMNCLLIWGFTTL